VLPVDSQPSDTLDGGGGTSYFDLTRLGTVHTFELR
jgi:hypothetical protein